MPGWIAILIIAREFAVSGLRSIAASEGYIIQASDLGKTKTVAQVAAIALLLGGMHWPALQPAAMALMWAVVFFAVVSAMDYFRKFWGKVDSRIKTSRRRELLQLEKEERLRATALGREASASARERAPRRPPR